MESTRVNMCDFVLWSDFFLPEFKTLRLSKADSKHEEDTGQKVRIDRLIRVCADYIQSAHCLLRVLEREQRGLGWEGVCAQTSHGYKLISARVSR